MFYVVNGNIYHTRGDSADIFLDILVVDEYIDKDNPGEAFFSVKRNIKDKRYLFQVEIIDNTIHIPHDLTKNLPVDRYIYDIQLHLNDGTEDDRWVTIGPFQYHLLPDVTY